MKKIVLSSLVKNIALAFLGVTIACTVDSCASSAKFQNSAVVPAAEGTVKVKKDRNKNYIIKVDIYNLAGVERLQTSKLTYVVWMVSGEQATKNIGRLTSKSARFSKSLKASLETISSAKPNRIFITAEDDGTVQYPNGEIILTTGNL